MGMNEEIGGGTRLEKERKWGKEKIGTSNKMEKIKPKKDKKNICEKQKEKNWKIMNKKWVK